MKNKQVVWVVVIVVLVLLTGGVVYYILQQQKAMDQLVQQFDLDKEELADEYNELSLQYEGYKFSINNDSLVAKLEQEQIKVQRLMEELRTVKATNATRINELKKELETLRSIMRGYVQDIDSLNRLNQKLTIEKAEVTQKYERVSQTVSQLSEEKKQLSERVNLASKLDAGSIMVSGITNKNKPANNIKKMDQILINFNINKNITAPTGEKMIYIRIQKPDGDVLVKSRGNVFQYENKEINYSSKKMIEYTGEEIPISIYWKIEEYLSPGKYRVDIFADGNLIGKQTFDLEN
jgi:DNA repair exonuclease SbcCD ATPase subunit